jgi:hypothetical protein
MQGIVRAGASSLIDNGCGSTNKEKELQNFDPIQLPRPTSTNAKAPATSGGISI